MLKIVKQSRKRLFSAGNRVIAAGSCADSVFIVCSGILSCKIGDREVKRLQVGHSFGEMAVYFDIIKVLFREHKSILGESIPLDRHAFINFPDKLILTFICFSV